MTSPGAAIETLHVSAISKGGRAILIGGPSGSGKSDLALRLIDRGARLISDDYTVVRQENGRLIAGAPLTIRGKLEVRGLGIVEMDPVDDVPVCLYVNLAAPIERLPEGNESVLLSGIEIPFLAVAAFEASAPLKIELALERIGVAAR